MEELLKLKDRVDIAVNIGESHYREFKSAFAGKPGEKTPRDVKDMCADIGKTLVAFANADGGELFVGIEDDNRITGMEYSEDKIEKILSAPKSYVLDTTPLPLKKATVIDYDGKKIAYFSVEKGSKFVHLTSKGECFQRKDVESLPTSSEDIRFLREEEISREYDRQFVELASISDLDTDLITEISSRITRFMSPEKFLQYADLVEFDGTRLRLRRAALLLFAKDIVKWHPRCSVRILRVKGIEEKTGESFNIEEISDERGNIFQLLQTTWEKLGPNLTETRFTSESLFKAQIIYPESACREALVNAICHRDYSIEGRGIEIKIFDDRLEILSPGKLLSSITIKDLEELKGVHQSRNTYIARVLRESGYIRELGEGIRRIFELMKDNDLVTPKIESPNKSFIVTLFRQNIYTKEEKIWLDLFADIQLNNHQKTVVRLGAGGRLVSPQEIFAATAIQDTEQYRQLVESLSEIGILKSRISRSDLQGIKKKKGVPGREIPRYEIMVPKRN